MKSIHCLLLIELLSVLVGALCADSRCFPGRFSASVREPVLQHLSQPQMKAGQLDLKALDPVNGATCGEWEKVVRKLRQA